MLELGGRQNMTCILNGLQVNAYLTRWFVSFAELSCFVLHRGVYSPNNHGAIPPSFSRLFSQGFRPSLSSSLLYSFPQYNSLYLPQPIRQLRRAITSTSFSYLTALPTLFHLSVLIRPPFPPPLHPLLGEATPFNQLGSVGGAL